MFIFLILDAGGVIAHSFPGETQYSLCFTPGNNCTQLIVNSINNAHRSIYIQAYGFTSQPILAAVVQARNRGVKTYIILDKSQLRGKHPSAYFLLNHHIPTWIDKKVAIAHNKVMIIDHREVITGSFNFTKSAQFRNAENVLIIYNSQLAQLYLNNWRKRQFVSWKIY